MRPVEKVEHFTAVFRSLFRGREDVVPRYWRSRKGGKAGYSPICGNEWVEGLCRKPCRTCDHASHVPLSDELLSDHFKGKHILGVYPLLPDGTCHFVAADFDDHGGNGPPRDPLADARAFHHVCEAQGLDCYLFRSKSGKGIHAYIFFASPVPARKARTVGFAILREAGVLGEDETISSFDRLFPNQDAPAGGRELGNLIACPYQGKAAKAGHTLLLDPEKEFLEPHEDQLAALESVRRIGEADLDRIISEWALSTADNGQGRSSGQPSSVGTSTVLDDLSGRCAFVRWCREHPENVSEPLWYALISNLARVSPGGVSSCHEVSRGHPRYSASETDAKICHALDASGPHTCETIRGQGFTGCPEEGCGVRSPVALANRHTARAQPEDEESIARKLEEFLARAREGDAEVPFDAAPLLAQLPRREDMKWRRRFKEALGGNIDLNHLGEAVKEERQNRKSSIPSPTSSSSCGPSIRTDLGQLREITEKALFALQAKNSPPFIFHRAGSLARIRRDENERPAIDSLGESSLRGHLARLPTGPAW